MIVSFVRRTGRVATVGDAVPLVFSWRPLGRVILQFLHVSPFTAVDGDDDDDGPPAYPGPLGVAREALVKTGLLGDGGGVSIGVETLDDEAEDVAVPWPG